jgi:hypothetical protein
MDDLFEGPDYRLRLCLPVCPLKAHQLANPDQLDNHLVDQLANQLALQLAD